MQQKQRENRMKVVALASDKRRANLLGLRKTDD